MNQSVHRKQNRHKKQNLHRRSAGFNLVELTVYLAVFGLVAALGIPPVAEWTGAVRMHTAAREISSAMHLARAYAIRNSCNVAMRFRFDEDQQRMNWIFYADGDSDGVRARDIERGIDKEIHGPRGFAQFGGYIRPGFPPGIPPRHPGNPSRRLGRRQDPIRFNRSDMASFSPYGTATPGTIYLTDGESRLTAVRTDHQSGRISIVHYDSEAEVWH